MATWILELQGEAFYLLEAQKALLEFGEASSGVSKEVRAFVEHGMLAETADGRRIYFVATASPFWSAYAAIASACGLTEPGWSYAPST